MKQHSPWQRYTDGRRMRVLPLFLLCAGCTLLPFESLEGGDLDAGEMPDAGSMIPELDAGLPDGGPVVATNLFALRQLRGDYLGPCVQLRRRADNALRDFGFAAGGRLDVDGIRAWAGTSGVSVVRWYDQSGRSNHAGPVTSDNMGGGAAMLADQPALVMPDGGLPSIQFDGSRMDARSPLNGVKAQTLVTCFNALTVSRSQRLLSWHFTDFDIFPDARGEWAMSIDPGEPMSLGVEPRVWHSYAARWQPMHPTGKQVFRDGELRAEEATTATSIPFENRDTVNIGWFRWSQGITFGGEVRELLIFSSALSDRDLQTVVLEQACAP